MNLKNNKSGFTLLEVIIVIIIVGVLASLALPRFFKTVEYSRATEALQNLSAIRQSLQRCYLAKSNNYTNCDAANLADLDIDDPSTAVQSHFTYAIAAGVSTFTITATRNNLDGGNDTDTITLNEAGARAGSGNYTGI